MKKIVIKEIDRLKSKLFKDKIVTEYLIYYTESDEIVETYTEIGEINRDLRLDKILGRYGEFDGQIYPNIVIDYIIFEKIKQINKKIKNG